MDKVKINKAIDALSLSFDNKNILKAALNQKGEADITEIETKVDTIDKELNIAKADISNLGVKVNDFINANEIIELGLPVLIMLMVQQVGFLLMEVMLLL